MARREAIESAGFMDERFFIYSEEPDLCLRMKRAGWGIRHLPLMTIVHHAGKGGIRPKMAAQDAFTRIQLARKHFSPSIALRTQARSHSVTRRARSARATADRPLVLRFAQCWDSTALLSANRRARPSRLANGTLLREREWRSCAGSCPLDATGTGRSHTRLTVASMQRDHARLANVGADAPRLPAASDRCSASSRRRASGHANSRCISPAQPSTARVNQTERRPHNASRPCRSACLDPDRQLEHA